VQSGLNQFGRLAAQGFLATEAGELLEGWIHPLDVGLRVGDDDAIGNGLKCRNQQLVTGLRFPAGMDVTEHHHRTYPLAVTLDGRNGEIYREAAAILARKPLFATPQAAVGEGFQNRAVVAWVEAAIAVVMVDAGYAGPGRAIPLR
jgi:hypothetical protein